MTADDMDDGAHSVAAPIRNHLDEIVAGISIAGPSERFDADTVGRHIDLVQEAAAPITGKLGNREPTEWHYQETPSAELAMPNGRWSTF